MKGGGAERRWLGCRQPERIAPPRERAVVANSGPGAAPASISPTLRRSFIIDLYAAIGSYLTPVVLLLVAVVAVLLVVALVLSRRIGALDRRLSGLTRGADERSLEAVLDAHLDKVFAVAHQVDDLATRTGLLETAGRKAFSRVGLVRYNPFEETGGNQSFALALLDANGDGWVLSSLHARSGTRVYAKGISGGRSDAALSDEETAAIRQATA